MIDFVEVGLHCSCTSFSCIMPGCHKYFII